MAVTYSELPNKVVKAANGVDYAYREAGQGTVPLILLAAMEFGQADVLGFSIGSFVAQDIALIRPGVLRRLILASSAPQGAAGMHGSAADVIDAVGVPEIDPQRVLDVFNTRSPSSRLRARFPIPASRRVRRRCQGIPQRSGPGRQCANQLTFSTMRNRAAPLIIWRRRPPHRPVRRAQNDQFGAARPAGMTIEVPRPYWAALCASFRARTDYTAWDGASHLQAADRRCCAGYGFGHTTVGGVPIRMSGAAGDSLVSEVDGLRWRVPGDAPSCPGPQLGRPAGLRRLRNPW